jgi:glycosyltransferase involved in cell wall biosynthesis
VRVLLVNAHGVDPAGGGAERYVRDLARGLAERGHELHVLAAFPARAGDDNELPDTVVLHASDWRDDPVRRFRNRLGDLVVRPTRLLEGVVDAFRPDLVHTSNLPGITTAVWEAARRLGVPVVHTLHDYYLLCPRSALVDRSGRPYRARSPYRDLRTRRLARWAVAVSHVVSGSEHVWRVHAHLFPGAHPHVVRLPLVPVAERRLVAPRTPPKTVGYLGALEETKGVGALILAAPRLAELGVSLQVAGDGRLRGLVERAAGETLRFAGPVHGLSKIAFFESTDIAVVPSRWDEPSGPPYVICEWLAAGRPVLASGRGGLAEAQRLPGVLPVEPDPDGIVDGVRQLVVDGSWRDALALLPEVTDERDLARWLDEHEAVYARATA